MWAGKHETEGCNYRKGHGGKWYKCAAGVQLAKEMWFEQGPEVTRRKFFTYLSTATVTKEVNYRREHK